MKSNGMKPEKRVHQPAVKPGQGAGEELPGGSEHIQEQYGASQETGKKYP